MSTINSVRLTCEPLRSLAFGSIGAGYTAVGTALAYPARMVIIQNLTDALLMFSFDGTNNHLPLSAGDKLILDITANKTIEPGFFDAKGQTLYVKQSAVPSTGSVYLTAFYGTPA